MVSNATERSTRQKCWILVLRSLETLTRSCSVEWRDKRFEGGSVEGEKKKTEIQGIHSFEEFCYKGKQRNGAL